jgi:hypothetical protein
MNSIQQSIKKAQDIMKNKNEIQNQERQKMILENAEKMTKQYRQANENIRNFIQDPNSIEMQSLVNGKSIMAGTINGCNCKDMSPSFFADLQAEYGKYFEIERYDLNNRDKNIIKGFNYMPICLLYFGMSSNRKVV